MPTPKTDMTYIVVEDFGSLGRAYVETDVKQNREQLLRDLIDGHYERPVRIIGFIASECDVSAELAQAVVDQAWHEGTDLPKSVIWFCERHEAEVPEIVRGV